MTERLLQYIWQFQYFNPYNLTTQQGEPLCILHPGLLNNNQGPDFFDAKIKMGNTTWAGNIELHLLSSHWKLHGHSDDVNYKNIILHVVWKDDAEMNLTCPVLELRNRISKLFLERYEHLMQSSCAFACQKQISSIDPFILKNWLQRLLVERLIEKSGNISGKLVKTNHHWEEVFWQLLAKNFGMKVNADAFEKIAGSIPLKILWKHKSQVQQLEALLLGQAGMLSGKLNDHYCIMLQKEYRFLQKKYSLQPVMMPLHLLRMRPSNFPGIRLAQLAMLVHQSSHLFSKILEATSIEEVMQMLDVTANDYWHYHYMPGRKSGFKKKKTGGVMISNIIINTIAPFLFAYGHYNNRQQYKERAIAWLEQLAPEKNSVTAVFGAAGITAGASSCSQAMIQLKNNYCNVKRCLECAVGNHLLKRNST